jgi:Fic family protein
MPDWDQASPTLRRNLEVAFDRAEHHAKDRSDLTLHDIAEWHQAIMNGLDVEDPLWVGHFRGDPDHAGLAHDVRVGSYFGTPHADVPDELQAFIRLSSELVAALDSDIAAGDQPSDEQTIDRVLRVSAVLHSEWVRIHPFINGNGRIARLLTAWVALRYGLSPNLLRLRPRPDGADYANAGEASMRSGDWRPTYKLLQQQLNVLLRIG